MQRRKYLSKEGLIVRFLILAVIAAVLGVSLLFSTKIEKMLNINQKVEAGNYVDAEVVKDDDFVIHYINVGQGDCTFIQLPDGKTMLIDTGDTDSVSKWHITDYISALGVTKINYFVLTHSDSDHIGGAKNVLDAFEVENIYRPFALSGGESSTSDSLSGFVCDEKEDLAGVYAQLLASDVSDVRTNAEKLPRVTTANYTKTIKSIYSETYIKDSNTLYSNVFVNYDGIEIDSTDATVDFSIKFYAPLIASGNINIDGVASRTNGFVTVGYKTKKINGYTEDDKNSICPVIKFEYKEKKFVFTGDITTQAEGDVLASLTTEERQELSNVTVYQAGHHGASNSNSQEWLNLLNPTYTVVSCGANNKYGHPTEDFLNRMASLTHTVTDYLIRTDLQGTIIFGVSEEGTVAYAANAQINKQIFQVTWWQIACGIFVVSAVIIFTIKVPKKYRR